MTVRICAPPTASRVPTACRNLWAVTVGCPSASARPAIAYARSLGKPVRFTHPEVDPDA
ncbi:hypothetical protein HD597_003708 [Nonomuraea thailandensis]|uniref:Uncharacterized protein n=1 Tax=Nonomuraea thailandensis TaxID=1188745 RepID=A0A9X2GLE4_9ACTN|nr:hypothetical protein [Nonomuraea thailandensis]